MFSANEKLKQVYNGDCVHDNPGNHLHGGVGVATDYKHRTLLHRLLPYAHQLYDVPRHQLGKQFVLTYADLMNGLGPKRREHNSEYVLLYVILILRKEKNIKSSKGIKLLLERRLERFQDPTQLAAMVDEAETAFKRNQSNLRKDLTDEDLARTYDSMCARGDHSKALRWLTDRDGGAVLSPSDIDDKTSMTVEEVLKSKHPPLRNVEPSFLEKFDTVPDFPTVVITGDDVEKVARKLRGSAGLANFDSIIMRNLLLQHGQASQTLREAFATFSTWMATKNVPWAVYRGFMMSRMVGLGKPDGGVRPVGIGDINRRFVAKIILSVTGDDATEACSSDQLCAGLKFGCEGGVHGMTAAFDVASANEDVGFMLVDADNAFNSFSRIQMLWNVRHAWPAGAWFAFNCYKHWSLLMVREPGGCSSAIINSREGVTQGDPFAMVMYAIGTLPLIRRVRKQAIDANHSWYADDSSVVGRFPDLKRVYSALCIWGVNYGYIPNSSKTKIIVPEHRLAAAQQYFNTESRLNFEVQSGARYLGGFVGSTLLRNVHVEAKISNWVYAI